MALIDASQLPSVTATYPTTVEDDQNSDAARDAAKPSNAQLALAAHLRQQALNQSAAAAKLSAESAPDTAGQTGAEVKDDASTRGWQSTDQLSSGPDTASRNPKAASARDLRQTALLSGNNGRSDADVKQLAQDALALQQAFETPEAQDVRTQPRDAERPDKPLQKSPDRPTLPRDGAAMSLRGGKPQGSDTSAGPQADRVPLNGNTPDDAALRDEERGEEPGAETTHRGDGDAGAKTTHRKQEAPVRTEVSSSTGSVAQRDKAAQQAVEASQARPGALRDGKNPPLSADSDASSEVPRHETAAQEDGERDGGSVSPRQAKDAKPNKQQLLDENRPFLRVGRRDGDDATGDHDAAVAKGDGEQVPTRDGDAAAGKSPRPTDKSQDQNVLRAQADAQKNASLSRGDRQPVDAARTLQQAGGGVVPLSKSVGEKLRDQETAVATESLENVLVDDSQSGLATEIKLQKRIADMARGEPGARRLDTQRVVGDEASEAAAQQAATVMANEPGDTGDERSATAGAPGATRPKQTAAQQAAAILFTTRKEPPPGTPQPVLMMIAADVFRMQNARLTQTAATRPALEDDELSPMDDDGTSHKRHEVQGVRAAGPRSGQVAAKEIDAGMGGDATSPHVALRAAVMTCALQQPETALSMFVLTDDRPSLRLFAQQEDGSLTPHWVEKADDDAAVDPGEFNLMSGLGPWMTFADDAWNALHGSATPTTDVQSNIDTATLALQSVLGVTAQVQRSSGAGADNTVAQRRAVYQALCRTNAPTHQLTLAVTDADTLPADGLKPGHTYGVVALYVEHEKPYALMLEAPSQDPQWPEFRLFAVPYDAFYRNVRALVTV